MIKKFARFLGFTLASLLIGLTAACAPQTDLTSYESQNIDWVECKSDYLKTDIQSKVFRESKVDCTSVLVPAVYAGSQSPSDFEIQLMRLSRAESEDFLGTIFINPGGPGGSGIEQLQYSSFPEELIAHYDIVGFDPRGVGFSTFSDGSEIKCSDEKDLETYFTGEGSPANLDEVKLNLEGSDAYMNDCAERNPLWWTLSTNNVVRDLEIMRQVVTGDKDLNLIGTSYGTTIAGMYVTTFPEHVGKIVLDSPTTVDEDPIDTAIEDARATEEKLTIYIRAYAKHAKISFDDAWEMLLEARQLADDDELLGYAGIVESKEQPGYMISSEPLLLRGILALNYLPEEKAIQAFNSSMDDIVEYGWNANFEWYGLGLDGYEPGSLEGTDLSSKKIVRSNSYEVMSIVNSMDFSAEEMSVADQKKLSKLMTAAAPMWSELNKDASGYEYLGPEMGLSWSSIAREDGQIPDPPNTPLARSNTSGKQLLIIGSLYEAVTPFKFAKDTARLLKSPLISVESDVHGPAAGYDNFCLNEILYDFFVKQVKIQSQTCSK